MGRQSNMKPLQLLSVFPRRPGEFMDRVLMIVGSRWESAVRRRPRYIPISQNEAWAQLSQRGLHNLASHVSEPALTELGAQVQRTMLDLPADAPFAFSHHGDPLLARLCYATSRALRPNVVVETGVCYGVTSAHLLRALKENQNGYLHSIDLPPLGKDGDQYVGRLIPTELKDSWTLHRGCSGKLLKPLLQELGSIDLFIHDSLHTYRNMTQEFALAWPALRGGGVVISDDIEGNSAFLELTQLPDVAFSLVIKEEGKDALLGVVVKFE